MTKDEQIKMLREDLEDAIKEIERLVLLNDQLRHRDRQHCDTVSNLRERIRKARNMLAIGIPGRARRHLDHALAATEPAEQGGGFVCHAPGDRCLGCRAYRDGKGVCEYAEQGDEWRPMDSSPMKGPDYTVGWWCKDTGEWISEIVPSSHNHPYATHWRPCYPPPAETEGE